ncbi:hypothetical protein ACSBOB_20370 [Mesorhizobium sp. ASY16-5R]|uniref:hypothetical protein n=1 Tax=Mesorhizobium sp. ASY16-5R TaxID=3445772 RepID=UPI003FA011E6
MIVYHGSPYRFDAFDPAWIGRGEGLQVYGHGFYFAAARAHAIRYARALDFFSDGGWVMGVNLALNKRDGGTGNKLLDNQIVAFRGDMNACLDRILDRSFPPPYGLDVADFRALEPAVRELAASGLRVEPRGFLYDVEIPDLASFISLEAPLKELPETVRPAFEQAMDSVSPLQRFMAEGNEMRLRGAALRGARRRGMPLEMIARHAGFCGFTYHEEGGDPVYIVFQDQPVLIRSIADVSDNVLEEVLQ